MSKKLTLGCERVDPLLVDMEKASLAIGDFLTALGIKWEEDVNMKGTPKRVAKMYATELYKGRCMDEPVLTDFDDDDQRLYTSLLVSGPWAVLSSCSHHMMPVTGHCVIGLLPREGQKLPGLSKYGRIVDFFSSRPQLQENLCEEICDYIISKFDPEALGVYIRASHACCTNRGIKALSSKFTTTSLRGKMMDEPVLRDEFLRECHSLMSNVD